MISKEMVLKMKKKDVVRVAGYKNIKALCKDNPDMCSNGKAPSKKQIIKFIF